MWPTAVDFGLCSPKWADLGHLAELGEDGPKLMVVGQRGIEQSRARIVESALSPRARIMGFGRRLADFGPKVGGESAEVGVESDPEHFARGPRLAESIRPKSRSESGAKLGRTQAVVGRIRPNMVESESKLTNADA